MLQGVSAHHGGESTVLTATEASDGGCSQETETELGLLVGSNLPRPAPTATSYKQASPPKDSTVSPARDQAPKT